MSACLRNKLSLIALLLVIGPSCSWLNKPYAKNPLIKRGRAVAGDPLTPTHHLPWEEPTPPLPPTETIPSPQPRAANSSDE